MDKKDLILKSALKLFGRYGYEKTSMNDIAKDANIGKGTIYYYFKAKEDIYLELLQVEVKTMLGRMRIILDSDRDPREKFIEVLNSPLDFLINDSKLMKEKWGEKYKFDLERINCKKEEGLEFLTERLIESLVLLKEGGYLRDDLDPTITGNAISTWIYGRKEDNDEVWHDREVLKKASLDLQLLSDIMLNGMLK